MEKLHTWMTNSFRELACSVVRDKNNFHMWRRQYEIRRLLYNYRQLSFLPPPKYNQNVRRKNPEIPDIL